MLLFRVLVFMCILAASLKAEANISPDNLKFRLVFPGEVVEANLTQHDQSFVVVTSCAPLPEGCETPKLKARSLKWSRKGYFIWEFADLNRCPAGKKAFESWRTSKTYTTKDMRIVVKAINPCLQKSYTTPPWQR